MRLLLLLFFCGSVWANGETSVTPSAPVVVQASAATITLPSVPQVPKMNDSMDVLDLVMAGLLALGFLWLLVSIWKLHRNRAVQFNALDLLIENGRLSKVSFIVMIAFSIWTWAIVGWTLKGTVTTADFLSYGGVWVSPLLARMVFAKNGDVPTPSEPPKPI